tara:strand:+ start:457 stop:2061 length:1605 start_codon:yes stop_codon:yes gene_type:complete
VLPFVVIKRVVAIDEVNIIQNNLTTFLSVNDTSDPEVSFWNWPLVLFVVYLIGVLIVFCKTIYELIKLIRILKSGKIYHENGIIHVHVELNCSPFSLLNYIVYNPKLHSGQDLSTIIEHEKVHCLQRHSLDMLLAQLYSIFYWFNPITWFYQKEIAQNLEYIADKLTLSKINSKKEYQYLLLNMAIKSTPISLINPFYNSLIKKRIIMLNKKKSTPKSLWKLSPILPLMVSFIFLFNIEVVAQSSKGVVIDQTATYTFHFDAKTTDQSFEKISKVLDLSGVLLNFKVIKRNTSSDITKIKISIKDNFGYKSDYAFSSSKGISPYSLIMDLEENKIIDDKISIDSKTLFDYTTPSTTVTIKKVSDGESEKNAQVINSDAKTKVIVEGFEFIPGDMDKLKNTVSISNISMKSLDSLALSIKELESILELKGLNDSIQVVSKTITKTINEVFGSLKDTLDSGNSGIKNLKNIVSIDVVEQPIFMVDGQKKEVELFDALSPNEIKSISVLKGESAKKMYGEEGVNGVIVIEMKKPKKD